MLYLINYILICTNIIYYLRNNMARLEDFILKQENIIKELEILYNKYKFTDLYDHIKTLKGSFDDSKIIFSETKNENCFNYMNFYQMYVKILNHENDLALFSVKDNSIEQNITKGTNPYIVSQNGYRWIKLISKKSENINNSLDPDYYCDYCIIDEVEKFLNDVNNSSYLPFGQKPELFIVFYESPNEKVIKEIENMNVTCVSINEINQKLIPCNKYKDFLDNIDTVNIDVNIIITLCSELSNLEKCDELTISAEIISKCVIGNITTLDEVIANKNYIIENIKKYKRRIICQSAYNKIMKFVTAFPKKKIFSKEIARMEKIFDEYNIEIVPDKMTDRISKIKHSNKLANCVFGTGDYYHAITITGYYSYIINAKQNRINIANIYCYTVEFSEKYLVGNYTILK